MLKENKPIIYIIEDNETDWGLMRNWLSGSYDIFPDNEDAFSLLREKIARLYGKNTLAKVSDEARAEIQELLNENKAALYVVDYQLITDNNQGHGVRFCDDFLPGANILLITGAEGKKGRAVINKMKEFCEKKNVSGKRDFICKQDFEDDDFRVIFTAKVTEFFPGDNNYDSSGY